MEDDVLLKISSLSTHFFTEEGVVRAVDGVDLIIHRQKTVCIVGESGCGKSMTARSILRIIEPPGRIVDGSIELYRQRDGVKEWVDLASLNPRGEKMRSIRGKDIALIFQEPLTSLSPVHTIGNQIREMIRLHYDVTEAEAQEKAIEALRKVGMPQPEKHIDSYTFRLSGGMRQRAMIAMALACKPTLLIADEPTTALDVTIQAQILTLMRSLQEEMGMSILLITHDLGVVAEVADEVAVMYLGMVVERGSVYDIFHDPKHPYTQALLRSIPQAGAGGRKQPLPSIKGAVPHPFNRPSGCPYHTRCREFMPGTCDQIVPPTTMLGSGNSDSNSGSERSVRCLLYDGDEAQSLRSQERVQ